MKTRLVRVGNSQAVRIPKPLVRQVGLKGDLEISVENNALVIRTQKHPRDGWEAAFRKMAKRGDDALLDADVATVTTFDQEEWEW